MMYWDRFWEFKVRKVQYENCQSCHNNRRMMELPESKRHCLCIWVRSRWKELQRNANLRTGR